MSVFRSMPKEGFVCPICETKSPLLDVVDLNKSCEEERGKYLAPSGVPVYYALCGNCGFCWAPELHHWPLARFEEWIYNDDYAAVDPDYLETRPKANANGLRSMLPGLPPAVRHLDYGGGNGLLARLLRESNWQSSSYDPFVDRDIRPEQLGKFELVTAFEVFEHVPDVRALMSDLRSVLSDDGVVLFSTQLSDGDIHPNQRLNWWYASPRNGHISLFSKKSLKVLARDSGFKFASFSRGFHILFRDLPPWASHLVRFN